jgi:hypothetical protein
MRRSLASAVATGLFAASDAARADLIAMFLTFSTRTAWSMRDIIAVLVVLAGLAGGAGLSWLASSLPTPTLSWQSSWSLAASSVPGVVAQ